MGRADNRGETVAGRTQREILGRAKLEPAGLLEELKRFPDPPRQQSWEHAVKTRENIHGGKPNVRQAHRSATLLHLASIAVRLGRKLQWDPVREEFVNDVEANRLAAPPDAWPMASVGAAVFLLKVSEGYDVE